MDAINVLFECNLNTNPPPVNAKNGRKIPIDSVDWIGIKGSAALLGYWGGSWVASDTNAAGPTMRVLRDDGTNGDKVAGDKVYSTILTFLKGTGRRICFIINMPLHNPAAEIDAGGTTPLDNEGGFGMNHQFLLSLSTTSVYNNFGNFLMTEVSDFKTSQPAAFELSQNYPNPFNPTTKINFSIPVDGDVVLKVYNSIGQEVATLLNAYSKAGANSVLFNASNLSSGVISLLHQVRSILSKQENDIAKVVFRYHIVPGDYMIPGRYAVLIETKIHKKRFFSGKN